MDAETAGSEDESSTEEVADELVAGADGSTKSESTESDEEVEISDDEIGLK